MFQSILYSSSLNTYLYSNVNYMQNQISLREINQLLRETVIEIHILYYYLSYLTGLPYELAYYYE